MSLNVSIYLPDAVQPGYENSMLVLPNEQGAALDDYHGALAGSLAKQIGMRVLAFERPFSADQAIFSHGVLRRHITSEYPALVSSTASRLNKIIEAEGVDRVITSGHSAAGLFALQMAVSEQLPTTGSFVTDPPAIRHSTPIKAEFIEYGGYELFTERRKPADDLTPNPVLLHVPPLHTLLPRHIKELTGYSAAYRSTLGFETLQQIATQIPKVGVWAVFPEHTFVAKPKVLHDLIAQSKSWRPDPKAMPFNIKILEKTYHSTFSNQYLFGKLLRQALGELVTT